MSPYFPSMNPEKGMRRLALLLGVVGTILACSASYLELKSVWNQSARHSRFEQLAASDVVAQERKSFAGWVSIDPKTGERIQWEQEVNKGGIKTIHWTKNNDIESIETEDGQKLFPTPAPAASKYLLLALFPVLGFFIPWGTVRATEWVWAGFAKKSELDNGPEIPIPAELLAQFEGSWKEPFEKHTEEIRRTFEISTGFYEKLVALDAASIAIAASVGGALIAKAGTPSPELRSVSHWLVWIIVLLWVSLVSGVGHNFVVVGIAQLEAAYSELDFVRTLIHGTITLVKSLYPANDGSTFERALALVEKGPQERQRRIVMYRDFLKKVSPPLGYVSMFGFIGAYTLVAICTWRLWL